jgi:hypothetical protein
VVSAVRRREFFAAPAALAQAGAGIVVDPKPLFEISPWLSMQFMEPLGATDSSVEAAWDYDADNWRADFVEATRGLAPQVIRWGGLYSRYYRWREGVGPAAKRPWARNYVWGGKETNRVGTHEFVDLCRRAGAEPLICVNFMGDGDGRYRNTKEGDRTGDSREAADWVSYANDPSNRERRAHGVREPYNIRLWQIGNETSYGTSCFPKDEAITRTIEFARAMKARDRGIRLIGWGDRGRDGYWARDMARRAGEWLDMIAFHMMGQSPRRKDTVLRGNRYQKDVPQAWAELLELADRVESRLKEMLEAAGPGMPVAMTEGHLSLPPHNANPLLLEWLSAVYHARSWNTYQRHGARVKIATIADFEGNRWTVNALLLQTPGKLTYMTPAGAVSRLFRKHNGTHGVAVTGAPAGLDIAASVAGDSIFLHVANTELSRAIETGFSAAGRRITGGRVFEIAPEDLRTAASPMEPDVFKPVERALPADARWRFPAGSVSAVELKLA